MFKQIYVKQLQERLGQNQQRSLAEQFVLLDVRQPHEHDEGHIPNSILIPLAELPERVSELEVYKHSEVIVYCKAGVRSMMACKYLAAHGFSNLLNLTDGMQAW